METLELDEARLSKNHRLVYDIVHEQGAGSHLRMSEVYELARTRRPGIGFTTVYRALTRLRDTGLVDEVALPGADSAFYETAAEPHAHFRCVACGGVDNIDVVLDAPLAERAAAQIGATIAKASLAFEGRCKNCRASEG